MDIQLNWTNPNTGEDGTRIYRSTSPMDPAALPTPLTTVGPGITSFTDTTVVRYQKYYYRFESFKGDDTALSGEREIWALPYTGPGNQNLLAGDLWTGYYGLLQGGTEFLRRSEITEALNFEGSQPNTGNEYIRWFKFAWKNKILFIPLGAFSWNDTWADLYNAGLVFGVDGPGDYPLGTPVNQLREVTFKGDTFRVRLMKGDIINPENSEWDQLFARAHDWVPPNQLGANWDRFTTRASRLDRGSSSGDRVWCQETQDPTDVNANRLMRGDLDAASVDHVSTAFWRSFNTTSITSRDHPTWWPVLELNSQPL